MGTALPWPRLTSAALPRCLKAWKPCPQEGERQFPGTGRTRLPSLLASCILSGDYWSAQTLLRSPEQHKARAAPTAGSQDWTVSPSTCFPVPCVPSPPYPSLEAQSSSFIHSKCFQSTRSMQGLEEPARQEEVGVGAGHSHIRGHLPHPSSVTF